MNLLAIDTSTNNLSFCVSCNDKVVIDVNRKIRFGSSQLISLLGKEAKKAKIDLKNIDTFVVGEGPGSFTGLRISFSIVKAFSLAYKRPVITVGSFYSCAYQVGKKLKKIAVIADARRNLIYCGGFESNCGKIRRTRKERLMTVRECIMEFKDYQFITYDTHLRRQFLDENPNLSFFEKYSYPRARYLLPAALELLNKKKFVPLSRLRPLYLHPKTCQIRSKR